MRTRSALLVASFLAGGATGSALRAQASALPRTYSITELNNMIVPGMTAKMYRDGARELMDQSVPASAGSPQGFHGRTLYDFAAHQLYTWDLIETSRPCGVSTITETAAPAQFDVISGAAEQAAELTKAHPKTVGTETLNGIPTTIREGQDPAGQRVRFWSSVKDGYLVKWLIIPKSGPPQVLLEVKELSFAQPAPSLFTIPAICSSPAAAPAPTPTPPTPPATRGNPTSMQVSAAAANPLPPGFVPPAGFVVDPSYSKAFDFFHVQIAYPKGGATTRIDPEGKSWVLLMKLNPPNKTSDETDRAMRASLRSQGWELLTPSGLLIAHKVAGGTETWFSGAAASGDYRATIVEVGKAPHALNLPAPEPTGETVGDGADYPFLMSFPGAKLVRTVLEPGKTFNAAVPGKPEELVGRPEVRKLYQLPASVSTYEFMVVYRDALTKAGWTIIRAAAGSDAQVIAHYAKNGRDIFVSLAGDAFQVADIGAQNEAKKLAADLARDGHVAIYGIYFDIDQATLKPESETALQHVLELLKANTSLSLEVQGHTDNTGTPAHNLPLSDQRAASVKGWLVSHGISAGRLTTRGYGETQPVADNRSSDGRAKNRRVELKKN